MHRLDEGGIPYGTGAYPFYVTRAVSGAPATHAAPTTKPERTDLASIALGEELLAGAEEMVMPESMEYFYDELGELKSAATGEGVTIAILDSGIDAGRLDIDVLGGWNFVGNDASYEDIIGHGTLTASVVSDTAGGADIFAAKVFDENGETSSGIVADAIRYAVDLGAKVLAMPFSLFPMSAQLEAAIDYAFDKGAIMIASAGNSGTEILEDSLASSDKVITVGSVDNDGKLSAWSNIGSVVDLLAPWDVVELEGEEGEAGTSLSAALVAGIAALMLEDDPEMTSDDVLSELKSLTASLVDKAEEETRKDGEIGGVSVDEVLSMYAAMRQNRAEFTGYSPKEDVQTNGVEQ